MYYHVKFIFSGNLIQEDKLVKKRKLIQKDTLVKKRKFSVSEKNKLQKWGSEARAQNLIFAIFLEKVIILTLPEGCRQEFWVKCRTSFLG